ncbi:MAG: hypothetical protein M3N42_08445, partial [Cyanobacteriota bacterium]|nr:hypothetical protein [Cyanobacteriota bacterium]
GKTALLTDNASLIDPTLMNDANIQYAPEADQIKCRSNKLGSKSPFSGETAPHSPNRRKRDSSRPPLK